MSASLMSWYGGPSLRPELADEHRSWARGIADFHSHLVPGVDDGAETLDQSYAALLSMESQGITTVITTPHIRASLLADPAASRAYRARVDSAWTELQAMVRAEFPQMRLERGYEVMLDVPHVDLSPAWIRLAGTRFVLVEFPSLSVPPNSARALFDIRVTGLVPIVAHPERYSGVDADLEVIGEWRRSGACLQVNAGSLLRQHGPAARDVAWMLLDRGWVDYLGSDYHARGECATGAAVALLATEGAGDRVGLLSSVNPGAVVADAGPVPVAPFGGRTPWHRIRNLVASRKRDTFSGSPHLSLTDGAVRAPSTQVS